MRPIKFRLWHKETKKFLNIFPYQFLDGNYTNGMPCKYVNNDFELTKDCMECNRLTGKSVFLAIDGTVIGLIPINENTTKSLDYSEEYELMQFTGLTDKNGKEIYAGDVIKYKQHHFNADLIIDKVKEVKFVFDRWNVYETNAGETDIEIIGSIFETPELLND